MKILKNKKIILIIVFLTVLYIFISSFIIVNIQFLQAPEILIKVDFDDVGTEQAVINTKIEINNPNNFDIKAENLKLILTTSDEYIISQFFLDDIFVNANDKKTFTKNITVGFNGHNPEIIKSKLIGDIGANILFIEKLIPINVGVVTSFENIINNIAVPSINAYIDIVDIFEEYISINSTINAYNPNNFEIYIKDISAVIETEKGDKVGIFLIPTGNISAKGSLKLISNGSLSFEALNAEVLIFNINGKLGGKFAGIDKNLPFNVVTQIKVPNLQELLFSKNPTIFSIKVDRKITLRGHLTNVYFQLNNTNKINIILKDFNCSVFVDVKEKSYFMGSSRINEDIVANAKELTNFSCSILTPWIKILPILIDIYNSDWYVATVQARVTISGVNQSIFIELRGYEDQHFLR